ncbi:23S rRNA (guanosine(2251)-2'-O)-methyltransferase RlmB [Aureispira anguillae]|uniref:23S rRNA (Guanosine(2251)-2'-O)-methyltransferase RlmB n=1 Tax=Aureispira anguillae TaxID=2864201 RepID=A0A916DUH4_9BACT|nr:23S rRNA (guanosine(2251)-2'-O)-methyltransferase RlmB [Aureispira anguillae]BDS14139.1 23S rRNA (guanosine(2251)-2'-O)-methyltransferase RlmB [Aureispira anguillae]
MHYKNKRPKIDKDKLIYGRHPVMDAIHNGMSIDKIMMSQGLKGEYEKELRNLCKERNIPLHIVPKDRINNVTQKNHQGVLGFLAHLEYQLIEDVFPTIYDRGEVPLVMVLDSITDVRNMGAIARSAEAMGVHALIIPYKKTAQINAEALKTSAGALSKIPVCRTASLGNAVDYLLMNGLQIVAADLRGKDMLDDLDLTLPTAIVMGAEDEGVRPHILRKATKWFKIPMLGTTDSFNVSVAAGIVLYETTRQRLKV